MAKKEIIKQNETLNQAVEPQQVPEVSKKVSKITPERRKEYAEKKRKTEHELRMKRKEEVLQNKTQNRRLAFISNIITASGYNEAAIARLTGKNQQLIHWYLSVRDDIKLSTAKELLEAIGINLSVSLKQTKPVVKKFMSYSTIVENEDNASVKVNIEGDEQLINTQQDSHYLPDYIMKYPEDGPLSFLAELLIAQKISITELCFGVLDIDPVSLKRIFVTNDIKISRLVDIAARTNCEICWKVERFKPAPHIIVKHRGRNKN